MKREDDPQLWDLLGRGPNPQPSPYFARNIIRAVRERSAEKHSFVTWLRWRRVVPALSAVAAVLLAFGAVQTVHKQSAPSPDERILLADGSDPDLAADLDVLVNGDDDDDSAVL